VVTLGKSAKPEHLLASAEQLAAAGFELHKSSRGGDVTYHGPGQLVGYPVLRVRDVRRYLRDLEEVLIRTLARFGVAAGRREPPKDRKLRYTGVWVGDEKIAAIGVALRRWVAYHGFALNVAPNLRHFDTIVPCGLHGHAVTSLERILGRPTTVEHVKPVVIQCFAEVFGFHSVRTNDTGH
jgi:lipoate-protein ligase B